MSWYINKIIPVYIALAPSKLGKFPSYVNKEHKQRCYMCKIEGKSNHKLGFVQTQCCSCKKGVCKVHHHILCPTCDTPSTLGSIPSYVDKEHKQRCYMCKFEGKNNDKLGFVQTQCCSCKKGVCKLHHNILCPPCAKSYVDGGQRETQASELVQAENDPLKVEPVHKSVHEPVHTPVHKPVHKQEKDYDCNMCDANFKHRKDLKNHTASEHIKPQDQEKRKVVRPFMCSTCGMNFVSNFKLTRHINAVHEKIRPFMCNECGTSFASKRDLDMHISALHDEKIANISQLIVMKKKIKTGDAFKAHPCPHCEVRCTRKDHLTRHIKTVHERQRFDKCPICQKTFCQPYRLKDHIENFHEGKKSFECPREGCDKTFSCQQKISKHIERVHEGKRPFSCDICGAGFDNKLRLARHIASEKCIVLKQAPNEDIKPTHEEKKL